MPIELRVWITRSQPGAERQAQELREAGYPVLVLPVLKIEAIDNRVPETAIEKVIFLSEHAVHGVDDPRVYQDRMVFAVGLQTAAALEKAGISAITGDRATSEGLLQLPRLQAVKDQGVLIVAGEGGRDLLAAMLTQRGARVSRLNCYRRVAGADQAPDPTTIAVIVVASGDGFELVARLWFAAQGAPDVPVLVPSTRVAAIGAQLGFTRIEICAGAASADWLAGLRKLSIPTHG